MILNSHFALNRPTVFRVESFSVDALVLRHDCFNMDGDAHTVSGKVVARSLFSGDRRAGAYIDGDKCAMVNFGGNEQKVT